MKKELLLKMITTPSVSGFELGFQKMLINELKDIDDKVITHHSYNVVHAINPESKIKVMLLAHIDEIGLMIERVLDNGICKLTTWICQTHGSWYWGQSRCQQPYT